MTNEMWESAILALPLVLELIGLAFAVIIDSYIGKRRRRMMLGIIALNFSLVAQNIVHYILDIDGGHSHARTLVSIYGYCIRPLIILLFYYIVREVKKHTIPWILIGINTAVHLTALFSGICFSIDENDNFHRGPLGYTCHILSAMLLLQLLYISVQEYSRVRRSEVWIPIFNVLLILASVFMDTAVYFVNLPVAFLTIAVVNSNVFYYIWLHLQFVREHEKELMAEQRIQIMMTQIQPHFLYNTLSTIQALCRTDPEKAFDTTERFGTYLRQNLDSLNNPDLVSLEKELEHTRVYADIEIIRFPQISIEYDIRDEEILLPALTIQPLVENAIRHGVRIRKDGRVLVKTRRKAGYHEITVRDNGKGFDTNELPENDGSHIGIENVRERIESMCGGKMEIESVIGEGTTVTIRIPIGREIATNEHNLCR